MNSIRDRATRDWARSTACDAMWGAGLAVRSGEHQAVGVLDAGRGVLGEFAVSAVGKGGHGGGVDGDVAARGLGAEPEETPGGTRRR